MPLSELHVLNVCQIGTPSQCLYLQEDEMGKDAFQCLKLSAQKKYIEDFGANRKADSSLPNLSKNDNCKGYPIFRYKVVGYDQKNC